MDEIQFTPEEIALMDPEDYKILLHKILAQAIEDYIKLQHPSFRDKKYLQEAFEASVDMFFDSEYRFLFLKNELGEDMSLRDMVGILIDNSSADMQKLRDYVIEEARIFWETKIMRIVYVPDSFIYDGHVYDVQHTDSEPSIDYEKKIIVLNKKLDSESEELFLKLSIEVLCHHEGIKKKLADKLGRALFRMLKINSCFTVA